MSSWTIYTELTNILLDESTVFTWITHNEENPMIIFFNQYGLSGFNWACIFIRFGTKLYRQVVGIHMGTNCAPLVADLFMFCYERDLMMSLPNDKQADVIDPFNTTSIYMDDILNINNVYFHNMVSQIYPSELQLNKANTSDKEAAF